MGANMSGDLSYENGDGSSSLSRPRLGDIPESCVASILMNLDPLEICKLARLNRAFRGASSADFIWESKLPSNYRFIADKLFNDDGNDDYTTKTINLTKKDLYGRLCSPNLFDGGKKEIWLDKSSGGLCVSISSKSLSITGIDDRRYWSHIPTEKSRFHTVAYLQQIWWLEVDGELEFQFPRGKYSLFFRLHLGKPSKRLGRRVCNSDQIHGWDIKPVRFQLTTSDGQQAVSHCFLDNPGNWVQYHVADFVVENPDISTKVKFSLTQIDCTHTKGGLCVDSVLICPSSMERKLDNILFM